MPILYVKNMVCSRCISSVDRILKQLNLHAESIALGEIMLEQIPSKQQLESLKEELQKEGFELLQSADQKIIAQIKKAVLAFLEQRTDSSALSTALSEALHKDYSALSKLFSQVEGKTIEHYFIQLRIERVKELITYNEMSLSQIADTLNFSSVAHLSAQFKKQTGMTPSAFKRLGAQGRRSLDAI